MTVERYVEQIPQSSDAAPVQLPLERGPGNFLLFQTSNALVNITLFFDGVKEVFAQVNGGIYVRRVKPWSNMRIDGAVGTQCTFFYGSEATDKDDTDIRIQVASIAGSVLTQEQPSATIVDNPLVACGNAALTAVAPANLLRRRITLSTDAGSGVVYARKHGGGNNLAPMQAGVLYEFRTTAAIDVRNDSGAGVNVYVFEEQ